MSSRTDSVLEFDQIRTILANYAVTEYGQQRLGSLSPTLEESKVLAALRDTSDARKVIDTVGCSCRNNWNGFSSLSLPAGG